MAFLLDDILFSPVHGVVWLAERVKETAEAEKFDESKIQESLLALQMQLEMGEITEEEYQERETELMERMEEIATQISKRKTQN
ncbi:MAG: gas vesicle protein GvpG [Deltaproteobacteria bacterium]|nr:gas vesicle protein GvpG [Deltaproteobacteria bacterium]